MNSLDRGFVDKFARSIADFDDYGVHLLFNDWWATAPSGVIDAYVAALEAHPDPDGLRNTRWLGPAFSAHELERHAPGTLGHAWRAFVIDNGLVEGLAEGYRALHDTFGSAGDLARMPDIVGYKVLRGYQMHDMSHVLTGYPATPYGELAVQAFQLGQLEFPYAAMWIAVVAGHIALVEPAMITPAMDAITGGWDLGRRTQSIQFIRFEDRLDVPLDQVRAEFGLITRN